ncbi:M23 family metallopeptidase [Flavobacterium sp.]|uniref:M23 family metallopeptidase n=1 Tax=Flavobacterium sp. TaxID=239 RepID=UPI00261E1F1C|nr:M23 family metallopeptidase [Flavobacterium sp.]
MKRRTQSTKYIIYIMTIVSLLLGCKSVVVLPSVKYNQYEYGKSFSYNKDTLKIKLENPLHCPLRVWFFSSDELTQKEFDKIIPITLNSGSDTVLTFVNIQKKVEQIRFSSRLGDLSKRIDTIRLDLPFLKNKKFKILQENNTNFTHNSEWSMYALDFDLKTNDTICSATDGFVVGVVDKYKYSGKGSEWKPYSNYLTIYEPTSGSFIQYVHLVENGSLVKIGDKVNRGQKIALSGNTGQSTEEHLHFSSLVPANNEDGLMSVPIEFVGGIKAIKLKKGDVLKK